MRPKRVMMVAGLVVAAVLWAACAQAWGAQTSGFRGLRGGSWSVRVRLPRPGAVVLGRSVRVVLGLPPGVRSLQVRAGRRVITGAFRRQSGRDRLGTLRAGREIRYGRDTLYFWIGDRRRARSYGQVSFVLARSVPRLLGAVRVAPSRTSPGHAGLALRLGRSGLRVRVAVNGQRAVSVPGRARRFRLLDADEGLRAGRNALAVFVLDARRGEFARRGVRLIMSRRVPIPGAGPSQRTVVGRAVQVDARHSRAALPGSRLVYRWQIASAPRGSRARLGQATTTRPRLRPDRPGRYILRVRVIELRRGRVGAAEGAPRSTDTTVLTVGENIPPIGYPVDTIARQDGVLGVSVRKPTGDVFFKADPTKALQLVVLDRLNQGGPPTSQSFTNDPAGAQLLLNAVNQLNNSQLAIITKPNATTTEATPADAHAAAQLIDSALAAIGFAAPPDSVLTGSQACGQTGQCSAFSAVGIPPLPGQAIPQGNVNPGLSGFPAGTLAGGDLHGFLELDSQGHFSFIDRERELFDTDNTDTPAQSTQATVTVGGTAYQSAKLAAGTPGFYVLVLDAGSLDLRDSGTYTESAADLTGMDTKLSIWKSDPSALVIVQSIGAVGRDKAGSPSGWDAVGRDLEALGGSRLYFNALSSQPSTPASNQYAQIGLGSGPGYPSPTTQVASPQRTGTGRLTGLLARSPSSGFYPDESRLPDQPLTGTLSGLLSTPSTPWPDSDAPGQVADACIASHLTPALPGRVEDNFVANTNVTWSTASQQIAALTFAQLSGCTGFAESDFTRVQSDLETEIAYLLTVKNWIGNLKTPFTQNPAANVYNIASHINSDQVGGTASPDVGVSWSALTSDLLWIVGSFPGFEVISGPLNVLAGGFGVAADWADDSSGGSEVTDITEPAAGFAQQLSDQYQASLTGLDHAEAIILNDWGRLKTAALNAANSPGATYDWAWSLSNPDAYAAATNALSVAAARNSYETLFPDKYRLYRAQKGTGTLYANDVTPYTCVSYMAGLGGGQVEEDWRPFAGTQRYGGAAPTVSAQGSTLNAGGGAVPGTVEQWVYATDDERFLHWTDPTKAPPTPPATLPRYSAPSGSSVIPVLKAMFNTPQNGVSQLFNPLQFVVDAYHNGTSRTETVTHQNYEADVLHKTSEHCVTTGRTSP